MVNCTKPIQMLTPTPTPIPIICTSGKIADPGGTVAFIGVYGYVTITNPSGAEIVHSRVAGNTSFAACPSGAGTYTVRMNLVRPDCYTCSAAVPTTQPTQNVTVTPTPTPTPLGLTTAVDKQYIPYQTWAFKIEQSEKGGKDIALVDVDVINGHIIWSQRFEEDK